MMKMKTVTRNNFLALKKHPDFQRNPGVLFLKRSGNLVTIKRGF